MPTAPRGHASQSDMFFMATQSRGHGTPVAELADALQPVRVVDRLLNQRQQSVRVRWLAKIVAASRGPGPTQDIVLLEPADNDHGNVRRVRIVDQLLANRKAV